MIDACDAKIATTKFLSDQLSHNESTAAESQRDPQSQSPYPTREKIFEIYEDIITDAKLLEEGLQLLEMIKKMPTHIEEGSEWFFLPKSWLDKWETYCYVDIINTPLDNTSVDLRTVYRGSPGKISFKELFKTTKEDQIIYQTLKFKW